LFKFKHILLLLKANWAQAITTLLQPSPNTDYMIMAALLPLDKMYNVSIHLRK